MIFWLRSSYLLYTLKFYNFIVSVLIFYFSFNILVVVVYTFVDNDSKHQRGFEQMQSMC